MFAERTAWNVQPNRFSQAVEKARRSGRRLLDLTHSNPTTCGLKYDDAAIRAALSAPEVMQYSPDPQGIDSARLAIAQYYRGLPKSAVVSPDAIFLTASTSEAYSHAFRLLCEPGDEVLVPHPGYPLFDFLGAIQDTKLIPYPLVYDHGWHIDLHSVAQAITSRTRAVVVVHPNNPTGSFVKAAEKAQLSALCSTHRLALIADEVFLDYGLSGTGETFAAHAQCLTFTMSGLSKISGLPQMKLAWMILSGPDALREEAKRRLEVIADTYLSVSTPIQVAASALLASRAALQRQLKRRLEANLRELDMQVASVPQVERLDVEGGWYATLRVPAVCADEELAIALIEQKEVVVHPGHFFDFPSEGFLVLSLLTPEDDFREGVRRLLETAA